MGWLNVQLADIPYRLAEIGQKNFLHPRERRRRVPFELAGMLTPFVTHSEQKARAVARAPDGDKKTLRTEPAVRSPATR